VFDLQEKIVNIEKVRDITPWNAEEKPWTKRTKSSVVPMLSSSEAHFLYKISKHLGSGNYVNLGVAFGGSVACLAYGLQSGGHEGIVYGIDNNSMYYPQNSLEIAKTAIEESGLSSYVKMCEGTTVDWARIFRKYDPCSFVFVDAGHTYQECLLDYMSWYPRIKSYGYIAFHDIGLFDVREVLRVHVDPICEFVQQVWNIRLYKKIE